MISALPGSETAVHHITTTSETQQKKKLRIDATSVRHAGRMRQRFSTSVLVTLAGGGGGGRQNTGGVGGWEKEQRELCSCSG